MTYEEFRAAIEARGLRPIDRGKGHWQIRQSATNQKVINWYPKTGTVWISVLNERFDDCNVNAVLAIADELFGIHREANQS